ncbi:MAG: class I SAM-dependent methyltransferase [Trueperaceae bacterium]|nr:class I SAM-dependent methyltransferase [Trueperaceae bacterium]
MASHDEPPHDPSAHLRENRRHWDAQAPNWVAGGERGWAQASPTWGIWNVPDEELTMLPADMTGLRAVELGCGTAYVSAWMARRGAEVTGIDASERQLATARRLARQYELSLTLVHGDAEATPFTDQAFDFAISEYGAAIWCDPYVWIPEAWRILSPGGRLVFLGHHPLATVCSPWNGDVVEPRLIRPYFGLHRTDWTGAEIDPGGIEFTLPLSDWMALFRRTGFTVEDLREPRPAAAGPETQFFVTADWARDWPSELAWTLRKPA